MSVLAQPRSNRLNLVFKDSHPLTHHDPPSPLSESSFVVKWVNKHPPHAFIDDHAREFICYCVGGGEEHNGSLQKTKFLLVKTIDVQMNVTLRERPVSLLGHFETEHCQV